MEEPKRGEGMPGAGAASCSGGVVLARFSINPFNPFSPAKHARLRQAA